VKKIMPMEKLNIANIAEGALIEQADGEIQRVLENIADPNTDGKKARKVTITLTFKPSNRQAAEIEFQTKSSIVPYNAVSTRVYLDKDSTGNVIAAEFKRGVVPGQTEIKQVDADTGELLGPEDKKEGRKIVNIVR
jgi:hypothetical protein